MSGAGIMWSPSARGICPARPAAEQGRNNGVPGMHIISGEEMRSREPNINPDVSGALWAPTGGICDPFMAPWPRQKMPSRTGSP